MKKKNLIKKIILAGITGFAAFSMFSTTFAADTGIHVDQVCYQ